MCSDCVAHLIKHFPRRSFSISDFLWYFWHFHAFQIRYPFFSLTSLVFVRFFFSHQSTECFFISYAFCGELYWFHLSTNINLYNKIKCNYWSLKFLMSFVQMKDPSCPSFLLNDQFLSLKWNLDFILNLFLWKDSFRIFKHLIFNRKSQNHKIILILK